MTTIISGSSGVNNVAPNTVTHDDLKSGQTVGVAKMQQFSAISTTSGTFQDQLNIPSWAKKITLSLDSLSTNGGSSITLRLGSSSIQSSGYSAAAMVLQGGASPTGHSSTAGFDIHNATLATAVYRGIIELSKMSGNTWAAAWTVCRLNDNTQVHTGAGSVTLSGTLDRIRLTTVNGTDQFDAGSFSVLVEGYE